MNIIKYMFDERYRKSITNRNSKRIENKFDNIHDGMDEVYKDNRGNDRT